MAETYNVKLFSYRQKFGGYLPLSLGYVYIKNREFFKRLLL